MPTPETDVEAAKEPLPPKAKIASASALAEKASALTLAEFLETRPPGSTATVKGVAGDHLRSSYYAFKKMDIRLHCDSEQCGGIRIYGPTDDSGSGLSDDWSLRFLTYACRNCRVSIRVFALRTRKKGALGELEKVGEMPSFGPAVPARVITLVGPDRDLFLKGRRAENQGLGVGSFAYYRRVVDSQWQRLVAEITRVAETTQAPAPMVATLKAAAGETQFSKAVEMIRDGIPDVLKVRGHNPLTLLYASLSDALHDGTDEHCLELAGSVRLVLTELAERIGLALKDEQELSAAVTKLLTKRAASKPAGKG
jgi:hypothetical protein